MASCFYFIPFAVFDFFFIKQNVYWFVSWECSLELRVWIVIYGFIVVEFLIISSFDGTILWMSVVNRFYFMARDKYYVHSVLSGSTPLLTFFKAFDVPNVDILEVFSSHPSVSTAMHPDSNLTQAISPAAQIR